MTSGRYKSAWRARCGSSRWGLRELIKQEKKLIVLELSFNEIDISPHPLSFFSDSTDLWGRDNHHISTPCRWKSTWVRLLKKTFVLLRRWIYAMMIPQGPCDLCLQFNVILSLPFIHCFPSIQAILPLTRFFFSISSHVLSRLLFWGAFRPIQLFSEYWCPFTSISRGFYHRFSYTFSSHVHSNVF